MNPRLAISILVLLAVLSCCCLPAFANTGSMGDMVKLSDAEVQQNVKAEWRERFELLISLEPTPLSPEQKEKAWTAYWADVVRRAKENEKAVAQSGSELKVVGTVVDQFGQPVAGAAVTMIASGYTGNYFLGGIRQTSRKITAKTKKDGSFVVEAGQAINLSLEDITAAGCQYYWQTQSVLDFHATDQTATGAETDWDLRQRRPVTLTLWRVVGKPERLCHHRADWAHAFPPPLRQGFSFERADRLLSQAQLADNPPTVELLLDILPNAEDPTYRTVILRVTAPPGNGVAVGKWFEFFAPGDDRYSASAEFVVKDSDQPCVFLRARQGTCYAKIKMEVSCDYISKRAAVALDYYVNPWGSRNLQLGNSKKVYPDELAVILRKQAEKQAQDAKPAVPAVPGGKALPPAPAPGP